LTTSSLTIRRATLADRDFVVSLSHRFAQTRAPWRSFEEVETGSIRALSRTFDEPRDDEVMFIAEIDGERVGFAFTISERDFFTHEPHAHLSEIATIRDGTGAAPALIAASETWSRDRGYRYLSLNVNEANPRGRAIYERQGYTVEYAHMTKLL
jgi:GNAT superfamily N-acetyltransferase